MWLRGGATMATRVLPRLRSGAAVVAAATTTAGGAAALGLAFHQHESAASVAHCEPAASGSALLQQRAEPGASQRLFSWGSLVAASSPDDEVYAKTRSPLDVTFFADQGVRVQQLSHGSTYCVALDDTGSLWVWGAAIGPVPRKMPCPAKVTALASTSESLYAITNRGRVLEWRDFDAQLRDGRAPEPSTLGGGARRATTTRSNPSAAVAYQRLLTALHGSGHAPVNTTPRSPARGSRALLRRSKRLARRVRTCNFGRARRPAALPPAPSRRRPAAALLPPCRRSPSAAWSAAELCAALAKTQAVSLAAGDAHVLIVGSRGDVIAHGDNRRGQCGLAEPDALPRTREPTALAPLPARATMAACGAEHSLVLLDDGSCVSFGDDRNLQLGLRAQKSPKQMREGRTQVALPEIVTQLPDPRERRVVAVAAGGGGLEGGHSLFLTRGPDGDELWVCGHGRWGQLGTKAFTHQSEPRPLTSLSKLREYDESRGRAMSIRIEAIGCGDRHSAALLATGNVFVWGGNERGQLGSGGSQANHTPTMTKSPPELRFAVLRGLSCGPASTAVWT